MFGKVFSRFSGKAADEGPAGEASGTVALDKKGDAAPPSSSKVCIDCQIQAQRKTPVPANDVAGSSSEGEDKQGPCAGIYQSVAACMTDNQGQVTKCTKEWASFQQCHKEHGRQA